MPDSILFYCLIMYEEVLVIPDLARKSIMTVYFDAISLLDK